MTKIINFFKKFKNITGDDQYQKKSLTNILQFFGVMLVFTLVAKGTAGAIMPKVTLGKVDSSTIVDSIDVDGQLELTNHMAIESPPNIKINDILVDVGEKVNLGDPLLEYDKSEVDKLVRKVEAEISKLQIQHKQLISDEVINNSALEDAKDRLTYAEEDLELNEDVGKMTLSKAGSLVTDARKDLKNLEEKFERDSALMNNASSELNLAKTALEALQSSDSASDDELKEANQRVATAQSNVNMYQARLDGFEDAEEQAKRKIGNNRDDLIDTEILVEQAEIIRKRSIVDAKKAIDSATEEYKELEERQEDAREINLADSNILKISLEEKQEQLKELKEIQNANYLKISTYSGVLYEWNIKEGEFSTEVLGAITDESLGYHYTFYVDEDDIKNVTYGMEVVLTQNFEELLATITAIGEQNSDGTFTVTAKMEDGDMYEGGASANINISEQEYSESVPSSAISQDDKGHFVLAIEERNTIMGLENVVQRIAVTVEDSSDGMTAITGSLGKGDEIILNSTKIIKSGDKVRLEL